MLEPETFLPLDYIQAKPLKERLRNITSVRGVKLLYDVLNFNPPDIKRAVLFVTNNSLVCETPEDAMKVAYEMEDGQRYLAELSFLLYILGFFSAKYRQRSLFLQGDLKFLNHRSSFFLIIYHIFQKYTLHEKNFVLIVILYKFVHH
jgi:chromosome segregation ATPase